MESILFTAIAILAYLVVMLMIYSVKQDKEIDKLQANFSRLGRDYLEHLEVERGANMLLAEQIDMARKEAKEELAKWIY